VTHGDVIARGTTPEKMLDRLLNAEYWPDLVPRLAVGRIALSTDIDCLEQWLGMIACS
jgi:hypothetical protein